MMSKIIFAFAALPIFNVNSIYLGIPTSIEKNPYLVSVVAAETNTIRSAGGVIISKNHILTSAAPCGLKDLTWFVRSGTEQQLSGGRRTKISKIICHEKHDWFAILVLSKNDSLIFDQRTKSIPLSAENVNIGEWGFLSGIGNIDGKHTNPHIYNSAIVRVVRCPGKMNETFCIGGNKGPQHCLNDYGASFVINGAVAGMHKPSGHGCEPGNLRKPGFYTPIADYKSWIEKKMEEPIPDSDVQIQVQDNELLIYTSISEGSNCQCNERINKLTQDLEKCKIDIEETKAAYGDMISIRKFEFPWPKRGEIITIPN